MEIKIKKVIEISDGYLCDICGKKVIQDGKDICLVTLNGEYKKEAHSSCVIRLIDKYGIKNQS